MKDAYGYITFSQPNHNWQYKKTVKIDVRKIENEGNPELQFEIDISTVKGGRLYREVGSLVLTGDKLAELVALINE